ncbi:MAG: cytochrome c nitrite reductase small subunit [Bacteroidales bacterium]|nr:cytochrome c nitrite reductase small subunit [Bacteroidales bacterium]
MGLKRFIKKLTPPLRWRVIVTVSLGVLAGLICYGLYVSKAHSYLSDKPETCVNCHIMAPQYATWSHSAHRDVAHCNDGHVPHNNVFNKYYFKAKDGLRHATMFTLRREPQVIFIKEEGKHAVQENCFRCHGRLLENWKTSVNTDAYFAHKSDRFCWECHRNTPHGQVNSLSSVPNARVPLPGSVVPGWMKKSGK